MKNKISWNNGAQSLRRNDEKLSCINSKEEIFDFDNSLFLPMNCDKIRKNSSNHYEVFSSNNNNTNNNTYNNVTPSKQYKESTSLDKDKDFNESANNKNNNNNNNNSISPTGKNKDITTTTANPKNLTKMVTKSSTLKTIGDNNLNSFNNNTKENGIIINNNICNNENENIPNICIEDNITHIPNNNNNDNNYNNNCFISLGSYSEVNMLQNLKEKNEEKNVEKINMKNEKAVKVDEDKITLGDTPKAMYSISDNKNASFKRKIPDRISTSEPTDL